MTSDADLWLEWRRNYLLYGTPEPSPRMLVRNERLSNYYDPDRWKTARLDHQGDITMTDTKTTPDTEAFDRLTEEQGARVIAITLASQAVPAHFTRNTGDILDVAEYIVTGDVVIRSKRKDRLIITRHRKDDDGFNFDAVDIEQGLSEVTA